MKWAVDKRCSKAGGYWRCAVKQVEYDRRYQHSDKGRAKNLRYYNSPMGRLNRQVNELARFRVRY